MNQDNLSAQTKAAIAVTDALFGAPSNQSKVSKICTATALARRLSDLCKELGEDEPPQLVGVMHQCNELLHDVMNNLAATKMHIDLADYVPPEKPKTLIEMFSHLPVSGRGA